MENYSDCSTNQRDQRPVVLNHACHFAPMPSLCLLEALVSEFCLARHNNDFEKIVRPSDMDTLASLTCFRCLIVHSSLSLRKEQRISQRASRFLCLVSMVMIIIATITPLCAAGKCDKI